MVKREADGRWVKGSVPNPTGRPVGAIGIKTQVQQSFLEAMRKEVVGRDGQTRAFFSEFTAGFIEDAKDPRSFAYKFIAERLFGENLLSEIDAQVNKERRENQDFLRFRVTIKGFDIQQRVLMSQAKDIGLMCGRRAGKSETGKLLASIKASEPRKRVLIIGLTITKSEQIFAPGIQEILTDTGVDYVFNTTDSQINLHNGSLIQFGGNANRMEREKYRGQFWDLIIVDEAQSQPSLRMMVDEILSPMLLDTGGTLVLMGTGPRIPNTYFEHFYNNPTPSGLRLNWNLSHNPHINDYQMALQNVREKFKLEETDPLYMREYLGLPVYDLDAVVLRFTDENYYTNEQMAEWINSQSSDDIRFVAGLDYGHYDCDALAVVMYSTKRNEKFLVYEYKKSGNDVTALIEAVKAAKHYIATDPKFKHSLRRDFDIYADTSDTKISVELTARYGIPVAPAIKHDAALALAMLKAEAKTGRLRVLKDGPLDEESRSTVFKRIETEGQASVIIREIDDEIYHPDIMKACVYALRTYWLTNPPDHAALETAESDGMTPEFKQFMEKRPTTPY